MNLLFSFKSCSIEIIPLENLNKQQLITVAIWCIDIAKRQFHGINRHGHNEYSPQEISVRAFHFRAN